jgi:hypothetical protein
MKKLSLLFILCIVSMLAFAQTDTPADSVAGIAPQGLSQAESNTSQAAREHPDWVQVPGELIRPDCVLEIPSGANVEIVNGQVTGDVTLNGVLIAHYDACPEDAINTRHQAATQKLDQPPSGNGWVEQGQWNDANHNVDSLEGRWTVPAKPLQDGSVIYMFNGLEPSTQCCIIQPVLQYGYNGYFGGNYWTIASWLVTSTNAWYSQPQTVHPGDTLVGYTEVTHTSGGNLYYEVVLEDLTSRVYTVLEVVSSGLRWSWVYGAVLEAYDITSCAQFPSGLKEVFSDISVYQAPGYTLTSPVWLGVIDGYGGPSCGFAVDINSESKITLHF